MQNDLKTPVISIVADPICPWCYYGEHQLEIAIQSWVRQNSKTMKKPTVKWLPFLLVPEVPIEGMDRKDFLRQRLGADDGGPRLQAAYNAVRSSGLPFYPERITTQPNSLYAHSLIQAAGEKQDLVAKAIAKAFFVEGADIGDWNVLEKIAQEINCENSIVSIASSKQNIQKVQELASRISSLGITGVPFFIVNETLGISGAQPSNVILEAMNTQTQPN
jgi:predicted DsbA family dithiol-disulfide isomerase